MLSIMSLLSEDGKHFDVHLTPWHSTSGLAHFITMFVLLRHPESVKAQGHDKVMRNLLLLCGTCFIFFTFILSFFFCIFKKVVLPPFQWTGYMSAPPLVINNWGPTLVNGAVTITTVIQMTTLVTD